MRRKLIKQGIGGLTISVPKKWTEKQGLSPGDELEVEESDQGLILSAGGKKKAKELELEISEENTNRIRTIVASAYRRGYDKLTLKSKSGFSFSDLNWIADSLTGYVITDQEQKKVIIKSIMSQDFEDVPAIISKLFVSTGFLAKSTASFLKEGKPDEREIEELAKSIIRLRDYCQRMIHLTTYGGDRSYEYNTLVFVTEKVAGNLKRIVRASGALKQADIRKIIPRIEEASELFSQLTSVLAKKDLDAAVRLNKKIGKMQNDIYLKNDIHAVVSGLFENLLSMSSRIVGILI